MHYNLCMDPLPTAPLRPRMSLWFKSRNVIGLSCRWMVSLEQCREQLQDHTQEFSMLQPASPLTRIQEQAPNTSCCFTLSLRVLHSSPNNYQGWCFWKRVPQVMLPNNWNFLKSSPTLFTENPNAVFCDPGLAWSGSSNCSQLPIGFFSPYLSFSLSLSVCLSIWVSVVCVCVCMCVGAQVCEG